MTDNQQRWRLRLVPTMAAVCVFALQSATVAAQSGPEVTLTRDAATRIVSYRITPGELTTGGISMQIYGDGRVVTQYPPPFTRQGTWELRLTPGEVDQLVQSLAANGVLDFDPAAVTEAKKAETAALRAAAAAGDAPTVFAVSDPDAIELEVRVASYRPAGARQAEQHGVVKTIQWSTLQVDKRQHPNIAALRGLAAADQELRGLLDRNGFTKVQ